MKTVDGKLIVIAGASRCGKTAYTRLGVEAVMPALGGRAWAWDPEDQWSQLAGWKRVTTKKELLALAQTPGPQRVAYVAGGDLAEAFDFWCGCVYHAGRYVAPLAAIAEELADVTTPNKAPGNWGILLRRGLKRNIWIWAISQRWAEGDKTALGNSSEFVIFRQNTGDDARYMARKTRVPVEEIDALPPFHYVRYNTHTFEIERGILPFAKKVAKKPPQRSRKLQEKPANSGI